MISIDRHRAISVNNRVAATDKSTEEQQKLSRWREKEERRAFGNSALLRCCSCRCCHHFCYGEGSSLKASRSLEMLPQHKDEGEREQESERGD